MPSTRQNRRSRTREEILDAARGLIREHGFDRLSLRGVARAVGYSPAGLYEYFASKDALLDELARDGHRLFTDALQRAVDEDPAGHPLVSLGEAYVAFALRRPEDFRLMFLRRRSGRTDPSQPAAGGYAVLRSAVCAAVAPSAAPLRPGQTEDTIAYALWALVHGMAVLRMGHLADFDADFETADRVALQALVRGFFA